MAQDYEGQLNGSAIAISFDVYSEDGTYQMSRLVQDWNTDRSGAIDKVNNWERIIMRLNEASDSAVTINFARLEFERISRSRNRKATEGGFSLVTDDGNPLVTDESLPLITD